MINCGATEDVRALLAASGASPAATRAVVVDARRPLHHNFNHDGDSGIVFLHSRDGGEEDVSVDDVPLPDGASGGETSDDGNDADAAADPTRASRSRSATPASNDENASPPRQRRRLSPTAAADAAAVARTKARAVRAARRRYYARGASFGRPAALTLFELAHALRADDAHALWLACVGAADALACGRMPRASYDRAASRLATLAAVLPGAGDEETVSVTVDVGGGGGGGGGGGPATTATATLRARLYGRVAPFDDVDVPLLRAWTARDALAHAPRVAAALETWTQGGRRRLDELLLRAGVGQDAARAPAATAAGVRAAARLVEGLTVHGPSVKLPPLSFPSFRVAWSGDRLAASDAAAAAAALLDTGGAGAPDGPTAATSRRAAFWRAWNALAAGARTRAAGDLSSGLDAARALGRAILADGGAVLTRRALRESAAGRFRWADLSRGGGLAHRDLLASPPALARLAAFLRDATAARRAGRRGARRAVVLVGPARAADGAVPVVAVPSGDPSSGNTFGALFRKAAAAVGAPLGDDGFDAAHVWLPGDAVERYVRELTVAAAGEQLAAAAGALGLE